jgi:hypothetical protein
MNATAETSTSAERLQARPPLIVASLAPVIPCPNVEAAGECRFIRPRQALLLQARVQPLPPPQPPPRPQLQHWPPAGRYRAHAPLILPPMYSRPTATLPRSSHQRRVSSSALPKGSASPPWRTVVNAIAATSMSAEHPSMRPCQTAASPARAIRPSRVEEPLG